MENKPTYWINIKNGKTISLYENENLLDRWEQENIPINYQCRNGFCGACRLEILNGHDNVHYSTQPLACIGKDEILPCCCSITGDIELGIQYTPTEDTQSASLA